MAKKIYFIVICLIVFSCNKKQEQPLRIAVAANMQFAMNDLVKSFSHKTGIQCETIVNSSGKLTAQIKENAPYNVFVAADMKYPTELFKDGFTTSEPKIYAYGKLVMWTIKDDILPSYDVLSDKKIRHISIANPKMAPYGTASVEFMNNYGILNKVQDKLVFGESISQANQFIISQSAEIGFTAKSVVLSPEMSGKGKWIDIDEKYYSPIAQGAVIINHPNSENEDAKKFYDFLFSEDAKKILTKYGYK